MKHLITISLFSIITWHCFADEAPVQPVHGGCVKPVHNNDIQLQNETINFYLEQDKYHVEVIYTFKNFGKKQKITMGFPNQTSTIYTKTIENFATFEGKTKLNVYRKFENNDVQTKDTMLQPRNFYECSDLSFEENETKQIVNTYTQEYGTDYDNTHRRLQYILTTGSLWKDDIESIKINVFIKNIPENELIARNAIFGQEESLIFSEINFSPGNFQKDGNKYSTELKNIEPTENIEIKFPPGLINQVSASSQLEENSKKYQSENAVDNNLLTCWVEGAKGSGINEYIKINITPYIAGGKLEGCYMVDKIGIVNGYTKSAETFKNNNRVKRIKVSKAFFMEGMYEYKEEHFEFDLKDQKEIQYLKFDKPQKASILKFTILDVYKGEKYDDTCISEIIIYPTDRTE